MVLIDDICFEFYYDQVYALAVPRDGLESLVHKYSKESLILLIVTIIFTVVSLLSFVFIVVGVAKREMHLCSSLIKQMEATRQAETKSMNKSLAIARASHDVRASLAGITGLIEISYDEVAPGSIVDTNLKQMDACIKDLLGSSNRNIVMSQNSICFFFFFFFILHATDLFF